MRVLDRLIWRELRGPFLNSVLLFLVLLFGAAYLHKLTDLLVKGVPFPIVAKAMLYGLPALVTQTLPMSMLLGSLLAFGRISGDSEHVALFAGGISFGRLTRPVAWLGVTVSLVTIAWNETVVPRCQKAYYELLGEATRETRTSSEQLEYTVKHPGTDLVDEYVVVSGGFDAKTRTLRKVTIFKMNDDPVHRGKPIAVVYADRAVARDAKGLNWVFHDGSVRYLQPDLNDTTQTDLFFKQTVTLPRNVRIGKDFFSVMQSEVVDNRQMTFGQLRDKINAERRAGNLDTLGDEVDLWEKLSLPLASLVFGLVGAPLGVRPHRAGRAMGFGMSIGIIFLYWVLYRWMYLVGKGGGVEPAIASFTPCAIGLVAALALALRTRQ